MIADHRNKLKKIKIIISDVDGVMTDGSIILGTNGLEFKKFNVQDGMGVTMARQAGLVFCVITGRTSESVIKRAEELHVDELFQGAFDKRHAYLQIKSKYNVTDEEIIHIGDDLLDLPLFELAGFSVSPANGREVVRKYADYITTVDGGHGVVREVVDMVIDAQGKTVEIVNYFKNPQKSDDD